MAKARDELGVPDVSSHSFRKAVATLIDDAGRSARIGADHLGHVKMSMTQDRYPRTGPPPGRRPAGASRQGRRVRIKRRLSADLAFQPDRKPAPTAPTATPWGLLRPVNGNTSWVDAPAASLCTRLPQSTP